ncbi:S24 family peptidase [Blastopirellula marina]|uniref:S24 family peptidase n=1 Tax=Blastopirellula marina TaxID=124 RepID=UPI001304D332|nr:S24 family peptidase [Blastopirellula marina]
MNNELDPRSQSVVNELLSDGKITFGKKAVGKLSENAKKSLGYIAGRLDELQQEKTRTIVDLLESDWTDLEIPEPIDFDFQNQSNPGKSWTLHSLESLSFRGLAPAGEVWTYDFEGQSHLIYGPNGCGKSSLLGAISWCLTGRVFRDDQAPAAPSQVEAFSDADAPKRLADRPDALSLLDVEGNSHSPSEEYYVAVKFIDEVSKDCIYLKRHSVEGLSFSSNGDDWTTNSQDLESSISELDIELQVLMPARLNHLSFGKNPDLIALFSKMIGLDQLEQIGQIARQVTTSARTEANKLSKTPLKEVERQIAGKIETLRNQARNTRIANAALLKDKLPLPSADVFKAFAAYLEEEKSNSLGLLVSELGLSIPHKDDMQETDRFDADLDKLSQQVAFALESIQKPLLNSFTLLDTSKWPSPTALAEMEDSLEKFLRDTLSTIQDRFIWWKETQTNPKSSLLLAAAEQYLADSEECPLCDQDIDHDKQLQANLSRLRPLAVNPILKKSLEDLSRSLQDRLSGIVSPEYQKRSDTSNVNSVTSDWARFKTITCPGLLQNIATKWDDSISRLASELFPLLEQDDPTLTESYDDDFKKEFTDLEQAFARSRSFVSLARQAAHSRERLAQKLNDLLQAPELSKESLLLAIMSGKDTSNILKTIGACISTTSELQELTTTRISLQNRIELLNTIANATEELKPLENLVRHQTRELFASVDPRVKSLYQKLYDNELLQVDMVTPGHAANQDLKDQFNVYVRSGNERVPMGPFSNAGRLRAIALSFAFALIEQNSARLKLCVFDDPALSLDDEHRGRFFMHLVSPFLDERQVILATHYETFYKQGELFFNGNVKTKLIPRRTYSDAVCFEPADLLDRLESAITEGGGNWREYGNNLRRWTERVLHHLSAFTPEPFVVFNNLGLSISNYKGITDPRVANTQRDQIIAAFESPQFEAIKHRCAHDEDPTETEVRDGFTQLKGCNKAVRKEIERLRRIRNHDIQGMAIEHRPSIQCTALTHEIEEHQILVFASAAASTSGAGIDLHDSETVDVGRLSYCVAKSDRIAPIAYAGQTLIVDNNETRPNAGDLVVAEHGGTRFLRRYWTVDHNIYLESVNSAAPVDPAILTGGECLIRRIVGVLFDAVSVSTSRQTDEWAHGNSHSLPALRGFRGIRVIGSSMEPIARTGQMVLVKEHEDVTALPAGTLACIDTESDGVLFKRIYRRDREFILCSANPNDLIDPIVIGAQAIISVYRVCGVLFETSND